MIPKLCSHKMKEHTKPHRLGFFLCKNNKRWQSANRLQFIWQSEFVPQTGCKLRQLICGTNSVPQISCSRLTDCHRLLFLHKKKPILCDFNALSSCSSRISKSLSWALRFGENGRTTCLPGCPSDKLQQLATCNLKNLRLSSTLILLVSNTFQKVCFSNLFWVSFSRRRRQWSPFCLRLKDFWDGACTRM